MTPLPLAGKRILVVEDEYLVMIAIEDVLQGLGAAIVGPHADLADAIAASGDAEFDAAVLDLNLDGQRSYACIERLQARQKPFLLMTGYSAADLPPALAGLPRLQKPFTVAALERDVLALFSMAA